MSFQNHNVTSLKDAMSSSVRRIGIVQSNMQNVNTVGFKTVHPDSVLFSDTLKDVFRDERQGAFLTTNQDLDLALTKEGAYFLVEGKDGPEKTRDGQFHVSENKKVVDVQGRELVILDQDPEKPVADFIVKGSKIEIDARGSIRADGDIVGRIPVDYESQGPGDNAYVIQGKLEASNVDLQENIVKLLQIKRHIDTVQGMLSMNLSVDKALIETYGRNV